MTIPTISTLPTAPARTDPPATFVTRADSFLAALVVMQSELNTSIGAMNTDIAGVNTDATAAAASASAAATSESNASTSESNAATSESNAASSAAAAASSYDQFDDRYLGSKASDPAVDNDGNALLTGALYFNTTSDDMKVYTGTTWKVTGFNPDSPTFTDTVTAPSFDLNSIAATNADTAVDVFVYDTRKDSDGGAWRKRTQNTSWYNETLDTATRGSRKEFPAVAVIVAESTQVTIYDGDDPDMPMWMVFNNGAGNMAGGSSSNSSVVMLNGDLVLGATGYAMQISFVKDSSINWYVGQLYEYKGNISERNAAKGFNLIQSYGLINSSVNDVAMTVLPNAPIDAATGLPVPTIAVGTEGGVSVITDSGAVYDSSHAFGVSSVSFTENNALLYNTTHNPSSTGDDVKVQLTIPTADGFTADQTFNSTLSPASNKWNNPDVVGLPDDDFAVGSGTIHIGFNYISNEVTAKSSGMTAQVTSEFNTGWMNGDIKLATLSDTDDTDVTGSQLVTNGTFNSDTSGWTASALTTSVASGQATLTMTSTYGTFVQGITTVVGKTYTITCDIVSETLSGALYLGAGTTSGGSQLGLSTTSVGSNAFTFTATGTTTYVALYFNGASSQAAVIDNFTARLAEEDRSVNDNGLQVFGTITKDPVATGADLVAYSGFSASNYLEQPYNSDLDFGTGDFCVMGWLNLTSTATQFLFHRGTSSNGTIMIYIASATWGISCSATGVTTTIGISARTGLQLINLVRSNGILYFYVDGVAKYSIANTANISNTAAGLRLGLGFTGYSDPLIGSMALLRISATAPTADQIAKIYEDEKVLFQENSKATLYGSSDSVTALAYDDDTELLHVGTSEGRSVFQGLRRVDNTAGAVGAAISASNGLVAED